jgi:hypothetical protein
MLSGYLPCYSALFRDISNLIIMGSTYQLDSGAADYLNFLGRSIHDCEMPGNLRVRVAASCLAIAQDHHHAIVVLLDHALFASSFALLRCEFEAYVRGEWLALCATDEEVEAFSNGDEPPPMRRMLEALENTAAFAEKNSLSNQGEILERNVRVHAHRRATRAAMGNG